MEKLKQGQIREDGMVFCRRRARKDGSIREKWVSPEEFKIFRDAKKAGKANWYENNKEKAKADAAKWAKDNPEKTKEKCKKWAANNPENAKARRIRHEEKRRALGIGLTPIQRLKHAARTRVRDIMRGKNRSTCSYLGCSWKELVEHLENQFTEGMTWENYGLRGWHIDHRMPLASAASIEDLIPLLHYSNLQPLWALDNLLKGDRIPDSK